MGDGLRVSISCARSPTGLLLRGWSPVDRAALRADRILAVRRLRTTPLRWLVGAVGVGHEDSLMSMVLDVWRLCGRPCSGRVPRRSRGRLQGSRYFYSKCVSIKPDDRS